MLRKIGLFGVIILLHFKSFAADNLSLIQNNNELTINYQIDNATDININEMLHSLLIKEKTTTHSPNGHFKVTIRIESKISKAFYDTLRLYSNGEFLLYRDYLLPEQITYQDNTKINIKDDRYPSISILENQEKQYIIGKRYIFFGKREKIKILGLDNNIALKHKITQAFNDIFNYYTNAFGQLSKKSPIIVIDFAENGETFYYKGDTLDDFLSYNILNTSKLNEEEYYRIYEFIAHEIFHLWNSYEHKHTGKSWLHEGSATYFAIRTLADLGYISKHKLLKLQSGYLDACYDYYKNNSNKPMNNNTSDYSYYICGNSLHILLERFENKHTVFKIWQALFKQGNYHSDDFIKQIKANKSIKNKTKSNLNDFIYQRNGVTRAIDNAKKKM